MAATTSTSCASILNFRANSVEHQSRDVRSHQSSAGGPHSSNSGGGGGSCTGKLDGVAMWIVNGVANAFFASLHRCSCIRIATVDDGDDAYNDDDLPLIFNDGNYNNIIQREGSSCGRRKTSIILDKDKKNKAAAFLNQD